MLRVRPLFFLLALMCISFALAKLSTTSVDKCVQATLKNKLSNEPPTKRGKRQFLLYFGDAGVEAAEVFSANDIRRVTALAKCSAGEDSSLFEDRTNSMYHFHDGGSNVTYLTGIFQTMFPELESKVRTIAQKALDRAEWKGDMSHYGIRSVQYLSFYKAGLKAHRATLKEKTAKDDKPAAFIVYPDQDSREEAEKNRVKQKHSKFDPDADEVVKVHLQPAEPPNAIAFTAVIQMSDRAQFAGGDILISKKKHARTTISLHNTGKESHSQKEQEETEDEVKGYDLDEDANYDDPEPEVETENVHTDSTSHATSKNTQDSSEKDANEGGFDVFNAETTWISRYTPELGSMLLVHGDYARGMRPVLYGRRNSLIIEYWVYSDGEVGVKRPSLGEAKPLKINSVQGEL